MSAIIDPAALNRPKFSIGRSVSRPEGGAKP